MNQAFPHLCYICLDICLIRAMSTSLLFFSKESYSLQVLWKIRMIQIMARPFLKTSGCRGTVRPRSHENGTERNDVELFQKTKEFLQVFTRERLETFRSVPKSGRL